MKFETPLESTLHLETPRLILEPAAEHHAQEFYELMKDPELHQYIPLEAPTLEKQQERCARWSTRMSPDKTAIQLNWAAREKASKILIAHLQVGVNQEGVATLGYLVARSHQGKGFATEGLREIFLFLKNTLGVKKIKAWADTRNIPSHRLALKLGMQQTEFIKDADFFKGSTSDEFVFSVTLN